MSESKTYLEATLFELPEPMKVPTKTLAEIAKLRSKAFKWEDCAEIDERKIRLEIAAWVVADFKSRPNFTQMLRTAIWNTNNNGETIKYLYFNERTQRIRIDNDFFTWAELVTMQIEQTLSSHLQFKVAA